MRGPRPELHWAQLFLSLGLTVEQVGDVLRAMATLYGAPRVVIEAVAVRGEIQWWIGTSQPILRSLETLIPTHVPGAQLVSGIRPEQPPLRRAVRLVAHGHRERSLNLVNTPVTSKALLHVLGQTHPQERLVIQIILGERHRPTTPPSPVKGTPQTNERRRLLADKLTAHGFGCTLRLGVSSSDGRRARQLLGLLLAALRTAESPRIAMQLRRESPDVIEEVRSPWRWPLQLSVSELTGLLGWPIGDGPFAGLPPEHPRPMPPVPQLATTGRIFGDSAAPGPDRPIAQSVDDSLRATLVLGPPGTGKSTLLANLALQDLKAGRGLVLIDPKRSLVEDVLRRAPDHRRDDIAILDPNDPSPLGVNPLVGADPELAADVLVHLLHELNAEHWGPRTQDILHASLLTLARRGDASLIHVPLLLTNPGFRRSVVGRVARADEMGLGSFWAWYESISEAERQSAIAAPLNKLRQVMLRPGLRAVLGQVQPRFDLDDVFTKRRVLLVSLSKGQLGPDGAKLLGSVVVNLLWQAATRRRPETKLAPVSVFVDELHDYLRIPGDLGDALATARGYGVAFTLATQHLAQVPTRLRADLLNNVRSRVAFQVNHEDAVTMARGTDLVPEDFTSLGRYQGYASLLSGGTPTPWVSIATRPLPEPTTDPRTIRALSRERYGRPLSDVEAGWAELASQPSRVEPLGRQTVDEAGKGGTR